ncbi:MAG: extracellular solute-binding protein [Caldilineaceae bacterium]|nr:extracellular solute-binding protein [Caldilineaceae bacterium]MBP8107246.1 extracellular solute-binding protein [Caldilineaceae bacterium]MBP8121356.1 extracellular solute-binding protein [Caldilineaceae bacterium]MBP9070661.1 extracellular solute-binding protein [Caldilineaceae bacterium]
MAIFSQLNKIRFTSIGIIGIIGVCLCLSMLLGSSLPDRETISPIDNTLTIYTNMDEGPFNTYLSLFTSKHPDVEVNAVRRSTGEITALLLAERDDPQADVVWGLSVTIQNLLEWNDVLKPYAPAGLSRVSPSFRDTSYPPYWVGIGAFMSALCVNTELLTSLNLPVPDSWASLVDPIYMDQVAMPSPVTSSTAYLIIEGLLEIDGEIKGWEYLDALHKNIRIYTRGSSASCGMVEAGEIAIGISNDQVAVGAQLGGTSVTAVFPAEGSGWDMEANSLVKKDVIAPIALTFLDWAISDEAMQAYAKDRAILSVHLENFQPLPGFPPEPIKQLIDKDFPWASANRDRIISQWLNHYGEKAEGQ